LNLYYRLKISRASKQVETVEKDREFPTIQPFFEIRLFESVFVCNHERMIVKHPSIEPPKINIERYQQFCALQIVLSINECEPLQCGGLAHAGCTRDYQPLLLRHNIFYPEFIPAAASILQAHGHENRFFYVKVSVLRVPLVKITIIHYLAQIFFGIIWHDSASTRIMRF